MYRISFVILHYQSANDTVNSVNSIIENLKAKNYYIVIVDNGSKNGSGEFLKEHFSNDKNIYVLISRNNLGFAKGNNLGYHYAKEKLNSDFIIVINNDIILEQSDFVDILIKIFEDHQYYIMGPDIVTPDKIHQNPLREKAYSKNQALWALVKKSLFLSYYKIMKILNIKEKYLLLQKLYDNKSIRNRNNIDYKTSKTNIVLQGACIIYSPLYIEKENYAFYSETFMYGEEDILSYQCNKRGYKMIYTPELEIIHLDGLSTKKSTGNNLQKNIFYYSHAVKGLKILLKLMDE